MLEGAPTPALIRNWSYVAEAFRPPSVNWCGFFRRPGLQPRRNGCDIKGALAPEDEMFLMVR
jgi:hypothetical protein